MTSYQLKLLAYAAMFADHLGIVLGGPWLWLRYLGRLAFPIFAWSLVQGEIHTKDFWAYWFRLLCFGLISQLPFAYALDSAHSINILLSLALSLLVLRGVRSLYFGRLYGLAMILAPLPFYALAPDQWWELLYVLLFTLPVVWFIPAWLGAVLVQTAGWDAFGFMATAKVVSSYPIMFWNGRCGSRGSWMYWVYPVHLAILSILKFAYLPHLQRLRDNLSASAVGIRCS